MPTNQALLIIDLQTGVCHGAQPVANLDTLIDGVNQRIARYRASQAPVIFVQHTDEDLPLHSAAWALLPTLDAQPGDYYVDKTHANAFYHTDLGTQLQTLGVTSLEIAGAQVEFCVDTTVKMAHGLGYQLTMVPGLTTTTANDF